MSNELNLALEDLAFKPAWWLPEGHTQTVWRKFRPPVTLSRRRQRIELADNDFIDIDWMAEANLEDHPSRPVVLVLHGLCGCSTSTYILSLQSALAATGFTSAAINFRGCSGETNRLARSYHSGVSEDLDAVFERMRCDFPERRFAFTGFSLGANVLLKWLGEKGADSAVEKAVAVSTPFLLAHCSREMNHGFGKLYGRYFVRRLVGEIERKKKHFAQNGNITQLNVLESLGNLRRLTSIWQFDDGVTAPLHGFGSAKDYYDKSSSLGYLEGIEIPTLLIQSRDDPLIPALSLPQPGCLNDNVKLELSDRGGHVGFFSDARPDWLESRILHHLMEPG
ncbi:MAG: alpha/beta fold hydrolase [Pseudohongiellaceae bacterium]